MPVPLLYFIRHGETDWNAEKRFQGQRDIPINTTGRTQAALNGRRLSGLIDDPRQFDFVASPLARARETMEIIRRSLELPTFDYRTDDRLKEVSYGEWEGKTAAEIKAVSPEQRRERKSDKYTFVPPRGESYAMLLDRVKSLLPHIERQSVIVCHGGIIRVLMHHLGGMDAEEAVNSDVPQDRIYRCEGHEAGWLD